MTILLLLSFFEGEGVALAERAPALWINPAGLTVKGGFGLVSYQSPTPGSWGLGLSLGGLGYTYDKTGRNGLHGLTFSSHVWGGLYTGTTFNFGQGTEGTYATGLLFRPFRFISLGGVGMNYFSNSLRAFTLGAGLRPIGEAVTLFSDVALDNEWLVDNVRFGGGLSLLKGLTLYGGGVYDGLSNEVNGVFAGIDISLGSVRLGGGLSAKDSLSNRTPVYYEEFSATPYPVPINLKPKKPAKLTLTGGLEEAPAGGLFGSSGPSFYALLDFINRAAEERGISGLLLVFDGVSVSFAQAQELRGAIVKFRQTGRKVIAYSNMYTDGTYYIASACDIVALPPQGGLQVDGLSAEKSYYTGVMEKLGIEADIERIDEFKSAAEPFFRKSMSPEDSLQLAELLEDFFSELIGGIAEGRKLSEGRVKLLIDEGPYTAKGAVRKGLVDTLLYEDQIATLAKELLGGKPLQVKRLAQEKSVEPAWKETNPLIAVVAAEGGIVDGRGGRSLLMGGKTFGDKDLVPILKKLRKNSRVKAVVLRVNSPGGAVLASDLIWRELTLIAEEKPLVISMGGVAASGGYYISSPGRTVLAEPTTITGSIGILGGKPVLKGFYDKIGLTKDGLKLGQHADAFSDYRHWTSEEKKLYRGYLEEAYDDFVEKAAQNREIDTDSVRSLGNGRVWSGQDAWEHGLVDTLGGLFDAIAIAKEQAGLKEAEVLFYPKPKGFWVSVGTTLSLIGDAKEALELLRSLQELDVSRGMYYCPVRVDF